MSSVFMSLKPGTADHMNHYAIFAKAAYQKDRMMGIPSGFFLDQELSNRNRSVYYNPESKKAVLAFRGTDLKSDTRYGDLSSDLLLALNMREFSARFKNATKAAKAVEEKYADYEKHSVGHSLGGSQAAWVIRKRPKGTWSGTTFASHTPTQAIHTEALSNLFTSKRNKAYLTNYTVKTDPISTGTWLTGSSYAVKPRDKDHHSLKNYVFDD